MKISKIISGIAAGVFAAFCMTFSVSAEPQDLELSVSRAVETNGMWGQSITYSNAEVNPLGLVPGCEVEVEYELEGEESLPGQYQVELILQNYVAEEQIWAQVVPYEYDDTHAIFDYDAMVKAYQSDDFTDVGNICIGDRGVKMIVTAVTIRNYDPPARETVTTAESEAETEAITEAETAAEETAAAETTAAEPDTSESGNNITLIIIIIAVVVVAAVVVVVIVVTKNNKKRFY